MICPLGRVGLSTAMVLAACGCTPSNALFHQDSPVAIDGVPEPGDRFGGTLASGDFDADGYADLVVAAHAETLGDQPGAGSVNVVYGGSLGLAAAGNHSLHQGKPVEVAGVPRQNDGFGRSLATGDFDRDGFDDLAVGVPGERETTNIEAGAVNVFYGSTHRLTAARNHFILVGEDIPCCQRDDVDEFGFPTMTATALTTLPSPATPSSAWVAARMSCTSLMARRMACDPAESSTSASSRPISRPSGRDRSAEPTCPSKTSAWRPATSTATSSMISP